jgi:hypothetical protein
MRNWLSTGVLILLLLALAIVVVLTNRRGPDDLAAAECRAAYGRAETARDSAMVDRVRPVTSRTQATVAASCATLRAAGTLNR